GPGDSPLTCTVPPAATTTKLSGFAGHSGARVNGTVPAGAGGLTAPFKIGMDPPPKFTTSVNVWSSPPLLVTRSVCRSSMLRYEGSNRQAGCPTTVGISGENSSARNSGNVVSPGSFKTTHVPGPTAALNVVGSQLSSNATLRSRFFSFLASAHGIVVSMVHT